jgi:hypothetical protein
MRGDEVPGGWWRGMEGRWVKDSVAGFYGRATSLTGWVARMAAVCCLGAVDGPGDPPA